MAYFRCSVGASGGGNGADLIVTCTQNFAGKTITCTDGSSYTKTQTCPSSSPYEVTFESIPTGTYTISGVISGQTFSTTKTITDFDALLADIPDGATVTPTDDIQTLLHCANIWDKSYSTVSALLADTTSLLAVISDNNAVDYLVRSSTFATDICADSTAMTYIGADDYCADTLLADSTWLNAICNSIYFESVLNVKIPTMTSNTQPSGTCAASNNNNNAYLAFDASTSTKWTVSATTGGQHLSYTFANTIRPKLVVFDMYYSYSSMAVHTFKLQEYKNGAWSDISGATFDSPSPASDHYTHKIVLDSDLENSGIRFYSTSPLYQQSVYNVGIYGMQIYGRAATS